MNLCEDDNNCTPESDVFFGKLTIKEIKMHILGNNARQTISYNDKENDDSLDTSIKIIEVHSTPNIRNYEEESPSVTEEVMFNPDLSLEFNSNITPNCNNHGEKIISAIDLSPIHQDKTSLESIETDLNSINSNDCSKTNELPAEFDLQDHLKPLTPTKEHSKNVGQQISSLVKTPDSGHKENSSAFKTPGKPVSQKKQPVTPANKTKFENVVSPVAFYIKRSPVPSLIKNVHPKKPIVHNSSIPKLIRATPISNKLNSTSKENINLRQLAYKSAKATKTITLPHREHKLPHSKWSSQVTSAIPKPTVTQHMYRENNSVKKQHDNSINDLTLNQADLSVCTTKIAFP